MIDEISQQNASLLHVIHYHLGEENKIPNLVSPIIVCS